MGGSALQVELGKSQAQDGVRSIKVVVWDLDETLWDGVLLEQGGAELRPVVRDVIRGLDERGILQSISSRNDPELARARLEAFGIAEYFIYPQIGWQAKSASIKKIAEQINVGLDTIAFVDDQAFEREEVASAHPKVLCVDASEVHELLGRPEFKPRFVTEDSRKRREMYLTDIQRNREEEEYPGPKEEFLATLGLEMTLAHAEEGDLQRAEELTRRTHQLNTTGYTYDYDELRAFMDSDCHDLMIASLRDRFGTYGKIGLSLIERGRDVWTLKLLLMSCRVMSRGVGSIMLNQAIAEARKAGVVLRAELVRTDRNRMMYVTFRLNNFQVVSEANGVVILENDCRVTAALPSYVKLTVNSKQR